MSFYAPEDCIKIVDVGDDVEFAKHEIMNILIKNNAISVEVYSETAIFPEFVSERVHNKYLYYIRLPDLPKLLPSSDIQHALYQYYLDLAAFLENKSNRKSARSI